MYESIRRGNKHRTHADTQARRQTERQSRLWQRHLRVLPTCTGQSRTRTGDDLAAPSGGAEQMHTEGGKHPKTMLVNFVGQRPGLGGIRALAFEVLEDAGPQAPQ